MALAEALLSAEATFADSLLLRRHNNLGYSLTMQNVHFTPPQLAPLFGINVSTIKRWINKGYLRATVTAGGHRRISREQLMEFVKKYPHYAKSSYVLKRLHGKSFCPSADCWKKYYRFLRKSDNQNAEHLIEKLFLSGASIIEILHTVITPALRQMAREWAGNKISVYEEHRMSFDIRLHLLRLDQFIPNIPSKKPREAILACAPGEFHELPLQLVALILKMNGWKTHILGINIHIKELFKAAAAIKPRVIVISKTYSTQDATAYIQELMRYADKQAICLAFGGAAWHRESKKRPWLAKKCIHYFPALRAFDGFLKDYKRR